MIGTTGIVEQVRLWDGLQSYWKMDETSGTVAADAIGSNDGTNTNATISAGKNNNGLTFNSTTSKVLLANSSIFNYERTQPFTISMWFKRNGIGNTMFLFNKALAGSTGFGAYIQTGNIIEYDIVGSSGANSIIITSTIALTDTTNWYHIVFNYNGSSAASGALIYINGVNVSSIYRNTLTTTILNSNKFEIGNRNGTYNANGIFDEVAVWNRALNPAEVLALYSQGNGKFYGVKNFNWDGLQSYWDFQTSGATIYDKAANIAGTVTNQNIWTTGGKNGNGLLTPAGGTPDSRISATPFMTTNSFTVSWWMKKGPSWSSANVGAIFQSCSHATYHYGLLSYFYQNNLELQFGNGQIWDANGRYSYNFVNPMAGTDWYHICVTATAYNTLKLYVNGVEFTAVNKSGNATSIVWSGSGAPHTFFGYIGTYNSSNQYIDEFCTFNRVLNPLEVKQLYNSGSGLFY